MVRRRVLPPLRTAINPRNVDMRDYTRIRTYTGPRPSVDFDWDAALYGFAVLMRSLGYELSDDQKYRIYTHAD